MPRGRTLPDDDTLSSQAARRYAAVGCGTPQDRGWVCYGKEVHAKAALRRGDDRRVFKADAPH
jgi:hypothetical protein